MARQIKGRFCEQQIQPLRTLDRRSLRYKRSGKAWLLIGCPTGQWMSRARRCKVGTRAYKVLTPASRRCPIGTARITK